MGSSVVPPGVTTLLKNAAAKTAATYFSSGENNTGVELVVHETAVFATRLNLRHMEAQDHLISVTFVDGGMLFRYLLKISFTFPQSLPRSCTRSNAANTEVYCVLLVCIFAGLSAGYFLFSSFHFVRTTKVCGVNCLDCK